MANRPEAERHYLRDSKVYKVWANMKSRCFNPNILGYENYGGRGITVCEEWLDFKNFFRDMGHPPEGMTLERRDNNGNYCKDNCIWENRSNQMLNRRVFKNNTSGVPGVNFDINTGRWVARVYLNGKRYKVYNGPSKDEAIAARKAWIK